METLLQRYEQATMHNLLVHTPLNLDFVEARLFSLALACIHKKHTELPPISIKFSEVFKKQNGSDYTTLTKACEGLMSKVVKLQEVSGKRPATELYNIISFLRLEPGTGMIIGTFNPQIAPYLISLTEKFTTLEVELLLTLKSPHTHRLLWLLKSHEYQKGVDITIDNLRKHFFGEEEEPSYPEYFELKRKVIVPAFCEIQGVCEGWDVKMEEVKAGLRKVIGLRFTIPKFPANPVVVKKDKKPKKSVIPAAAPATTAPAAASESAPLMRVNKDEPAPLAQVMQAATAQLLSPQQLVQAPQTSKLTANLTLRLKTLKLTTAQIEALFEVIGKSDDKMTQAMKGLNPLYQSFKTNTKGFESDIIAAKAMSELKTLFPAFYHKTK